VGEEQKLIKREKVTYNQGVRVNRPMKVEFLLGKRVVETSFVLVHQQFVESKPILDNSVKFQTGCNADVCYIPTSSPAKQLRKSEKKTPTFSVPLGKIAAFGVLSDVKLERQTPQEMADE
jgi:hypothetical protein